MNNDAAKLRILDELMTQYSLSISDTEEHLQQLQQKLKDEKEFRKKLSEQRELLSHSDLTESNQDAKDGPQSQDRDAFVQQDQAFAEVDITTKFTD